MKILALDVGDRWVGTAISDALGITCKPFMTIVIEDLEIFIKKTLESENIRTVVIGYPKTLGGNESNQTKKTVLIKENLEQKFGFISNNKIEWFLWDERLSSKRAAGLKVGVKATGDKQKEHSVAAAFILQSFLDFKSFSNK